eukprot:g7979.t1
MASSSAGGPLKVSSFNGVKICAPSPAVISIDAQNFFNSRSRDIMLDRAYANDKLFLTLHSLIYRGTLSMLLACNSVVKQSHDAIELTLLLLLFMLITLLFLPVLLLMLFIPLVLLSPPLNGIRIFLLTLFSGLLALILDPPSELAEFAAEHNKSIEVGFCKLLDGIIGNYNDDRWRSSLADAVVGKAFTRIDAVFDALSSPDISHQISYHILSSTLPSYLMHTLRITPPATLLPILDRFHLRFLRSVLHCFGVSPAAFDSLPSYLRRAVTCQLFLPCRLGGFKLLDLPMLAPIAYAASISQSLPRILPILRMAAPDYIASFTHSDLDLALDDPVVHPMFLEIAPTIDRLRVLQRAFPTSSHSNSSSLPISIYNVLPKCSPLSDVSNPISFSQYLYHFSDITSPYLSDYIRLRGRSKHNAHLQKCVSHLFSTAFGTLNGSHPLIPLPLCVTVFALDNCVWGRTAPEWYEDYIKKKVKSLRYNTDYRNRIEVLQEFHFPESSQVLRMSRDGKFLCAAGVYKPCIKMFELDQLALKFSRHLDAQLTSLEFLSDDFRKLVLLRNDRTLEFHAAYGRHHTTRIPKFGRALVYDSASCDLYVPASGSEVYRLNLEQGRFLAPLATDMRGGMNCGQLNPVHRLLAFGGDDGSMECWDPRDRTRVAVLHVAESTRSSFPRACADMLGGEGDGAAGVSALRFGDNGLELAIGTTSGHVLLYDLRASQPRLCKDHRYGLPVKSICFHDKPAGGAGTERGRGGDKLMVSADSKSIKIWERRNGEAVTAIEPSADVNDVLVVPGCGLVLGAGEQHAMMMYYIPELGPAPSWCSFLDNLTEELEQAPVAAVYDDYKFVTREQLQQWGLSYPIGTKHALFMNLEQLEQWGLSHLIGTKLLRAYMHGFFMDIALFSKIKAVTEPYEYEQYVAQKVERRLAKKRAEGRIVLKQSQLPAVNRGYAQALLQSKNSAANALLKGQRERKQEEGEEGEEGGKAVDSVRSALANPLADPRFSEMFSDENFQIDTSSAEFTRINPRGNKRVAGAEQPARQQQDKDDDDDDDQNFELLAGEESEDENQARSGEDSEEDYVFKKKGKQSSLVLSKLDASKQSSKPRVRKPAMYELKQGLELPHLFPHKQAEPNSSLQAAGVKRKDRDGDDKRKKEKRKMKTTTIPLLERLTQMEKEESESRKSAEDFTDLEETGEEVEVEDRGEGGEEVEAGAHVGEAAEDEEAVAACHGKQDKVCASSFAGIQDYVYCNNKYFIQAGKSRQVLERYGAINDRDIFSILKPLKESTSLAGLTSSPVTRAIPFIVRCEMHTHPCLTVTKQLLEVRSETAANASLHIAALNMHATTLNSLLARIFPQTPSYNNSV